MVLLRILILLLPVYLFAQTGYTPIPAKQWNKDTVLNTKAVKINSQGGLIVGGYNLNSDAVIEASSTTKGALIPRMTTAQRNAITAITPGLYIYNTTDSVFQYYRSSGWTTMSGAGATGPTGPTGATGATGAAGATGATGVITATNGVAFLSSGVIGLDGALSEDTTHIEMNPFNQQFAFEDSSASNKYHLIKGSIDGVPSLYSYDIYTRLRADSILHLRGDDGIFLESTTGIAIEVGSMGIDIAGDDGGAGDVLTADGAGNATWQAPSGGSGDTTFAWSTHGNTGTSQSVNSIGTLDNIGLSFRTNNTIRSAIDRNGKFTFGSTAIQSITATPTPFMFVGQDTASQAWLRVQNQNTAGTAGVMLVSEATTAHGPLPANAFYGYIGLNGNGTADTNFQASLNIVSGSNVYRGIQIFPDNGPVHIHTSPTSAEPDFCVARYADTTGATPTSTAGFIGIHTQAPTRLLDLYGSVFSDIGLHNSTTGSTTADGGAIVQDGNELYIINKENDDMYFRTRDTNRIQINGTGQVSIGNITPGTRDLMIRNTGTLTVFQMVNATTGTGDADGLLINVNGNDCRFNNRENGSSIICTNGTDYVTVGTAGAVRFHSYGAGTATFDASGNITSVSDERLKEIKGNYKSGLKELLGIEPVIYKWNELSGYETQYNYAGFSAQNVKANIPLSTGVNEAGYLTLQDRAILATLVNAVKELKAEIEELKKKK